MFYAQGRNSKTQTPCSVVAVAVVIAILLYILKEAISNSVWVIKLLKDSTFLFVIFYF